jgi:hypothetical protein
MEVEDIPKFHSTENGMVRTRVGRGGRIVMDRKVPNIQNSSEYQQFNILSEFNLRKYEPPPQSHGLASSFKLSNACNHKIDNFEDLRDQFYFEVE